MAKTALFSEQRESKDDMKYDDIPVTRALMELLTELDHSKYKGTDRYLFAPDIKRDRNRVLCDDLSRAFTHYFNHISNRKLTFKSLRKAYITAADAFTKGDPKLLSRHTTNKTAEQYYVDKKVALIKAIKEFEVFPEEEERKKELEEIRNQSQLNKINQEVTK